MFSTSLNVLAATLAVAAPSVAFAQTSAPVAPVAVTSSTILNSYAPSSQSDLFVSLQTETTTFAVSFTNTASEAATAVTFAIEDGKTTKTIVDRGTFAPGVAIRHTFRLDDNVNANAKVDVAEVDFADGRVWHAGSAIPQAR